LKLADKIVSLKRQAVSEAFLTKFRTVDLLRIRIPAKAGMVEEMGGFEGDYL
jgi:hypothetical protein